jgi:hypothetical protein
MTESERHALLVLIEEMQRENRSEREITRAVQQATNRERSETSGGRLHRFRLRRQPR